MHPTLLMLVSDAARQHDVEQCWRAAQPAGLLATASSLSDAALLVNTLRVAVIVMDGVFAGASPALLRHFRRQSPHSRILVFGDDVHSGNPPVRAWDALQDSLEAVLPIARHG
jgi:DNA-binding NarL/FixJ family response regulator